MPYTKVYKQRMTRWMLFHLHLRRNHFHVVDQEGSLITILCILSICILLLLHCFRHFVDLVLKTDDHTLILLITPPNREYHLMYFFQWLQFNIQCSKGHWAIEPLTAFLHLIAAAAEHRKHFSDHYFLHPRNAKPHASQLPPYLHVYFLYFML